MKQFFSLCLVFISVLFCAVTVWADFEGESNGEKMVSYSNEGVIFSIPEKYNELFAVETPADGDFVFEIYDKEFAEAKKTSDDFPDHPGLLFVIDTVTEEEYHELLCSSRSFEVFAGNSNGLFYVIYYPYYANVFSGCDTYINFEIIFLDNYPDLRSIQNICPGVWMVGTDKGEKLEAVEWFAKHMKDVFIADNGLTAEKHGKSSAAKFFSRMLYDDDLVYTIGSSFRHDGVNAAEFLKPFVYNVSYKVKGAGYQVYYEPGEEEPNFDSDSVRINFPYDYERHGYYSLSVSKNNYVSICNIHPSTLDSACTLWKAVFEDETLNSGEIFDKYIQAVKLTSPGTYGGTWISDFDPCYEIKIKSISEVNVAYDVKITFRDNIWTMKMIRERGMYVYHDGKRIERKQTSDGNYEETVLYENGKGVFFLMYGGGLKWVDETEHYADNDVFDLYYYKNEDNNY